MINCHSIILSLNEQFSGGIAQLGERYAGSVEVRGSSPLISICIFKKSLNRLLRWFKDFFVAISCSFLFTTKLRVIHTRL